MRSNKQNNVLINMTNKQMRKKRGPIHMKFSITEQDKGDLLIQVAA